VTGLSALAHILLVPSADGVLVTATQGIENEGEDAEDEGQEDEGFKCLLEGASAESGSIGIAPAAVVVLGGKDESGEPAGVGVSKDG
jgi:hypothetical protein